MERYTRSRVSCYVTRTCALELPRECQSLVRRASAYLPTSRGAERALHMPCAAGRKGRRWICTCFWQEVWVACLNRQTLRVCRVERAQDRGLLCTEAIVPRNDGAVCNNILGAAYGALPMPSLLQVTCPFSSKMPSRPSVYYAVLHWCGGKRRLQIRFQVACGLHWRWCQTRDRFLSLLAVYVEHLMIGDS